MSTTNSRLNTRPVLAILLIVGALLVAGLAVAFVRGYLPTASGPTHPPCEQLPTIPTVDAALDEHAFLVESIEAVGPGVRVGLGTPCEDGQDRALVDITYTDSDERDAITAVLNTQDGFGVPVYVHSD